MELSLKYGCNPHQTFAKLTIDSPNCPLKIICGQPSYINILDALNSWQLVKELDAATGKPSAASFKHVSPAGAAIAGPLTETFRKSQFLDDQNFSPIATAYIRARGGDRMCSYGDVAAVSRKVDLDLANFLKSEVCDLIIAPEFDADALQILKTKKKGSFIVLQIDPAYSPDDTEMRELFGFKLFQTRNNALITSEIFNNLTTKHSVLTQEVIESLLVATITLKYTQSNSIALAYAGQAIGIGAGQQSRVHCTRLACGKADKWILQQHPKVANLEFVPGLKRFDKTNLVDQYLLWNELSPNEQSVMLNGFHKKPEPLTPEERLDWIAKYQGIVLSSDAYIPFRDNIDRASRSNVQFIAHTGGALRDEAVIAAANEYQMTLIQTGIRLFTH